MKAIDRAGRTPWRRAASRGPERQDPGIPDRSRSALPCILSSCLPFPLAARWSLTLAVVALGLHAAVAAEGPGAAFTLDLARFRTIDPALRRWTEHAPIRVKTNGLTAIAAEPGPTFLVAAGRTLMRFGLNGNPLRSAELPVPVRCLAVAPNGDVAIGFERGFLVCTTNFETKAEGPELGEKALLTSLAAGSNVLYAADAGQRIVWSFDHGGRMLGRNEGPAGAGFSVPSPHFDVALDRNGMLWVVNPGELRLESYGPDGAPGARWGKPGFAIDGFCGCCNPTDIARFPDGSFVTVEKGLVRIKVHRADGSLESVVAGPDEFPEGTAGIDVAVDSRGRVLAIMPQGDTVRVFVRKPAEAKP